MCDGNASSLVDLVWEKDSLVTFNFFKDFFEMICDVTHRIPSALHKVMRKVNVCFFSDFCQGMLLNLFVCNLNTGVGNKYLIQNCLYRIILKIRKNKNGLLTQKVCNSTIYTQGFIYIRCLQVHVNT